MRAFITAAILLFTLSSVQAQVPSYIPQDGLVGYWPFNTSIADESKKGFDGVNYGAIYTKDRLGKEARALQLGKGFATLPKEVFQFQPNEAFTVSFWFTHEADGNDRLLSTENTEGNFRIANWNGEGRYAIQYGDYQYDSLPSPLEWNHVVYVYDNRHEIVYQNGKVVSENVDSVPETRVYGQPFAIGTKASSPGVDLWNGKIDDLAIWSRPLNFDEVSKIYRGFNHNVTPDSILGYRKVETHQAVTYALRNRPELTYKWTATGGYLLGPTTNHFCDVIWGYDKAGSVCCIVSDSTCTDTICVQTTITEKNTVNVDDITDAPSLVVRPNPVSDVLQIDSRADIVGSTYDLIDVTGRRVLQSQGPSAQLSLVSIAEGVYHVVHRDAAGTMIGMQRVVVRR